MLGPVAAGILGTLGPAFGWLPALGAETPGFGPFAALFDQPGIGISARLSLVTGIGATLISLAITLLVVAALQGTRIFGLIERLLSPLLAVPHAAAAFGLAFLIAPSGWIARLFSPWATGWERPPDILTAQDPAGLALIAGLVVKEVPFLLLMTLAALGQTDARRRRLAGLCLGYGPIAAWFYGVLPGLYAQIRLPVYAVLAYSMSTVEVAMILGPTTPAPLSVRLIDWMNDPDLGLRLVAAAGAILQMALVGAALLLWRGGEIGVAHLGRRLAAGGRRFGGDAWLRTTAGLLAGLSAAAVILGIAGLGVWSFAGLWRFPEALPDTLTMRNWARHGDGLLAPAITTCIIGVAAASLAALLAIACLETEHRHGERPTSRSLWLLYTPLLVPQTGFLFGLQITASAAGFERGIVAVIATHLVFVVPYVFLSLSGPWRVWDERQSLAAACLGASPWRVLFAVRLPMLLAPLLTALAVGFAVSVGQYLPTLLIGAGRVATLTTEAVALSAGGDRRLIGLYGLAQAAAPLPAFALALALPAILFRRRRGMTVAR
ncbi:MAG: ABC transporter permease subunit [Pseudomonadota bacterium]